MSKSAIRVALIQLAVTAKKSQNITNAVTRVKEAAKQGARLVALPECFNCPYGTQYFAEYAESIPGPTTDALADAAKDNNIFLVGGSIPEKDGNSIYNTCTVFSPSGSLIGKYRKMHLFDIDVPGKIRFQESDVLTRGSGYITFDADQCKVGIGICYDIRFPELAQIYTRKGCHLLLFPGAFNMTTGPAHWELLIRSRAVDNQVYVAAISPARDMSATYNAWGHTTAVNPWGEVLCTTEDEETTLYTDINMDYINEVRDSIPVHKQKRTDMYTSPREK